MILHKIPYEFITYYTMLSIVNINSNKVHQYFHDFLAACFELPAHAETLNSI